MTIFHMPVYKELKKIFGVRKDWENVNLITMNFGSFKEYNMENRFFNRNLAGGAMLDIGVYALSVVRSFMDEQPNQIISQWKPSPTALTNRQRFCCKIHPVKWRLLHCRCIPSSPNAL